MVSFVSPLHAIDKTGSSLYVREQAQWLFAHDGRLAIECFKTKSIEPFKSLDVFTSVKQYGGVKHIMSYLEYVVLERATKEDKLHTELACLYVQCINSMLRKVREQMILAQGDEEEQSELIESAPASQGNKI